MILLSDKDISKIERALGIVEGVSCGVELHLKTPLSKAIRIIEEVINEEGPLMPQRSDTE